MYKFGKLNVLLNSVLEEVTTYLFQGHMVVTKVKKTVTAHESNRFLLTLLFIWSLI